MLPCYTLQPTQHYSFLRNEPPSLMNLVSVLQHLIKSAQCVVAQCVVVYEEADGKKRQELKELFVPDIIKFLFNRLPRTAILTEFQKLYEQKQDHI